jgi:hypothetical protein
MIGMDFIENNGGLERFWEIQGPLRFEFRTSHVRVPKRNLLIHQAGNNFDHTASRALEHGFSVVPEQSKSDPNGFTSVYVLRSPSQENPKFENRNLIMSDFVSSETTIEDLFELFSSDSNRAWYLTIRGNSCDGIVTRWDLLNGNPLRMAIFNALSIYEKMARSWIKRKLPQMRADEFFNYLKELRKKYRYPDNGDVERMILNFNQAQLTNDHSDPVEWILFNDTKFFIYSIYGEESFKSDFPAAKLGNINQFRNAVMHSREIYSHPGDFEGVRNRICETGAAVCALDTLLAENTKGV